MSDWWLWVAPGEPSYRVPWWRRAWYLLRYGTTNPTLTQLGWVEMGAMREDGTEEARS